MLVHMAPQEVQGLQHLAMAAGGSLTINPHTGLPEAGFLSNLLPMIAGGALAATGIGAPLAAGLVGAGDAAITHSWKKGLMAGIGAYGGGSLASGLGAAGDVAANSTAIPTQAAGEAAGETAKSTALNNLTAGPTVGPLAPPTSPTNIYSAYGQGLPNATQNAFSQTALNSPINSATGVMPQTSIAQIYNPSAVGSNVSFASNPLAPQVPSISSLPANEQAAVARMTPEAQQAYLENQGVRNAMAASGQGTFTQAGPWASGGFNQAMSNMNAGIGTLNSAQGWGNLANQMGVAGVAGVGVPTAAAIQQSMQKQIPGAPAAEYWNGSYDPRTQTYSGGFNTQFAGQGFTNAPGAGQQVSSTTGSYANPWSGVAAAARGGSVNHFATGGLGSFSDGGHLLKGPGDGMSDDIPAHITGNNPQPAALADGEFVIPADVVSHLGNGSTEAGSRTLYNMMDKVRKARTGSTKQGKQIDPSKFIPG